MSILPLMASSPVMSPVMSPVQSSVAGDSTAGGTVVSNWTELHAALAAMASTGGTIFLADGVNFGADATGIATAASSKIYIRSQNTSNMSVLPSVTIGAASNIELQYVDFSENTLTGNCLNFTSASNDNLTFRNCMLSGASYSTTSQSAYPGAGFFDASAPSYATIAAGETLTLDVGHGVVTVTFQVTDTTASAVQSRINSAISAASQTAWLSCGINTGLTAIRLVGIGFTVAQLASQSMTVGGTAVTKCGFTAGTFSYGANIRAIAPTQRTGVAASAGPIKNISFYDCTWQYLNQGYLHNQGTQGAFKFIGNTFFGLFVDKIQISPFSQITNCEISWNIFYASTCAGNEISAPSWTSTPHPDYVQFTSQGDPTATYSSITLIGNVIADFMGVGYSQPTLISDMTSGMWKYVTNKGNLYVSRDGTGQMPQIDRAPGSYFFANTAVNQVPGDVAIPNNCTHKASGVFGQEVTYDGYNIATSYAIDPTTLTGTSTNITLTAKSANASTYMSGITGSYSSISDLIAQCARTTAPIQGYVDYNARTVDVSKEPAGLQYDIVSNTATSSTITTTTPCRIKGGGTNISWTLSAGAEVQFYSDVSRANPSGWFNTSGTGRAVGDYVDIRHTSASTGATSTTSTLTINGYANTFTSRTASAVQYIQANNTGTPLAGSQISAVPAPAPNQTRFLVAIQFQLNTLTAAKFLWGSPTLGTYLQVLNSTTLRFQFQASSTRIDITYGLATGTTYMFLIAIDTTKTILDEQAIVVINDVRQPLSGTSSFAAGAFNPNTSSVVGAWRLFSQSGANNADCKIGMFYNDWGTGANIDITSPAILDGFEYDNMILGWPGGVTPKYTFYGPLTDWNAASPGITNKGSISPGTVGLVKATGTYT